MKRSVYLYVTAVVAPVAAINNYLLPIWMIVLGVILVRRARVAGDFAVVPRQAAA